MRQSLMLGSEWLNSTMNIMKSICHKLDAQGAVTIPWSVLTKTKSPPEGR